MRLIRRLAVSSLIVLGALAPAPSTATSVEPPLAAGPSQVRSSPEAGQTWEDLRALHRERAEWWVRYYEVRPGPMALRTVLSAYEDWIEALFDQRAINESRPYASRLEDSHPSDVAGLHLVARFMHFDQRFAEESRYLIDALAGHPRAIALWLEVGNALGAQGLIAEPDPYAIADALHVEAVTTVTALRGRLPIIRASGRASRSDR